MSFLNPHKTFCKKCCNISWTNPSPGGKIIHSSWEFDHYTTFFQLEASADKGCHLCQNIWTTLVHDNPSTSWYAGKSLTFELHTEAGVPSWIAMNLRTEEDERENTGYGVNIWLAARDSFTPSRAKGLFIERTISISLYTVIRYLRISINGILKGSCQGKNNMR